MKGIEAFRMALDVCHVIVGKIYHLIFVREMYPHRITKWWLAGSDSKEQGFIYDNQQ